MHATWKSLLEVAIRAPSGDNCQPWLFKTSGSELRVYNCPDRDDSLYNLDQKASFIAHGALIENIALLAQAQGLGLSVSLFPDSADPNLVSLLSFQPCQAFIDARVEAIAKRTINRKRFSKKTIESALLKELNDGVSGSPYGKVTFAESGPLRDTILDLLEAHDRILLPSKLPVKRTHLPLAA